MPKMEKGWRPHPTKKGAMTRKIKAKKGNKVPLTGQAGKALSAVKKAQKKRYN